MNPQAVFEHKACRIAKKGAQIAQINCFPFLFGIGEASRDKRHRGLAGLDNALRCLAVFLGIAEQFLVLLEICRAEGLEAMFRKDAVKNLLPRDRKALFNIIHEFAHQDRWRDHAVVLDTLPHITDIQFFSG